MGWEAGLVLMLGVFLVWVVWDILNSINLLNGVRAENSNKVQLSRNRNGCLTFTVHMAMPSSVALRVGVLLPDLLECKNPELTLIPADNETRYLLELPFRAVKRGSDVIRLVSFETDSLHGFWRVQSRQSVDWEVQVYPDVMAERRHLAGLLVRPGMLGIHSVRQLGKGKDFEKLREYVPGDDYQDIHWKASDRFVKRE